MATQIVSYSKVRFALSGAAAGVASTLVFTIVHEIFISDIRFMLVPMLIAGALCGALVSWSYGLLVAPGSLRSWLGYNLIYVVMFALLGVASVLLFEPVTTMGAVSSTNGPPEELIDQAMPMTAVFTFGMAALITLLYNRSWVKFAAVLLTCTVLVASLGLNVSIIGLVFIPSGSLYLIGELFGLIVALNAVYAVTFMALDWRRYTRASAVKSGAGHSV
jgi:hypothetical protein